MRVATAGNAIKSGRVVSHGLASSHFLADTRKMVQHCKATMFGHGRIRFLLILPRRIIPDGNSFAPLAFLHRQTWPVGKAFQRGNYS